MKYARLVCACIPSPMVQINYIMHTHTHILSSFLLLLLSFSFVTLISFFSYNKSQWNFSRSVLTVWFPFSMHKWQGLYIILPTRTKPDLLDAARIIKVKRPRAHSDIWKIVTLRIQSLESKMPFEYLGVYLHSAICLSSYIFKHYLLKRTQDTLPKRAEFYHCQVDAIWCKEWKTDGISLLSFFFDTYWSLIRYYKKFVWKCLQANIFQ